MPSASDEEFCDSHARLYYFVLFLPSFFLFLLFNCIIHGNHSWNHMFIHDLQQLTDRSLDKLNANLTHAMINRLCCSHFSKHEFHWPNFSESRRMWMCVYVWERERECRSKQSFVRHSIRPIYRSWFLFGVRKWCYFTGPPNKRVSSPTKHWIVLHKLPSC